MTETGGNGQHVDLLWQVEIDAFIGKAMVSEAFSVDGMDEEFDILYDWEDFGPSLWTGTRASERYDIVQLLDFEPQAVVLRHAGETVGFYNDAICWIDEDHRARGLSIDLIRVGIGLMGEVPDLNLIGFSRAGWAAHAAAHRASLAERLDRSAGTKLP